MKKYWIAGTIHELAEIVLGNIKDDEKTVVPSRARNWYIRKNQAVWKEMFDALTK